MEKIVEFLKWALWGRWHGVSVSADDVRRARMNDAPEVGRFNLKRWIPYLLGVIIFMGILLVGYWMSGVILTTGKTLDEAGVGVFVPFTACKAYEASTGRLFVAVDCLGRQVLEMLRVEVPGLLVAIVSFLAGWVTRGIRELRKKEDN